jgi:hypothetical protein
LADQLSIAMLADQDMSFLPAVGQWHHQLLGVPKCNDHPLASAMKCINMLLTMYA